MRWIAPSMKIVKSEPRNTTGEVIEGEREIERCVESLTQKI